MQFDRTRIAIRERSPLEVLDLALRVVRIHAPALAVALAVGVAPLWLLNHWLLAGLIADDLEFTYPGWHMFLMVLLILWEMPLATSPVTLFLGQALFTDRPRAWLVAGDFVRRLPQLILLQGMLRPFFPLVGWSYLNEVILLERNPLFRGKSQGMSTMHRAGALHRGERSDFAGRAFLTTMSEVALSVALWLSLALIRQFLLNEWRWDEALFVFYWPLAWWMAAGFFTVVRFLSYLDLRIRREGWEVELLMRAEEARLRSQLT